MDLQVDTCDVAVGEVGVLTTGSLEAGPFDADVFRICVFEFGVTESGICEACEYCLEAQCGNVQGADVFENGAAELGLLL